MKPKIKDEKKIKDRNNSLLCFKGMPFEEVLSDLLKVKPEPKSKKKSKRK
ncbi:MAG: hypothetical protein ABSB22_04040 [Thermodesulfobacteriota bacterium]|jgi:hypothetical protein